MARTKGHRVADDEVALSHSVTNAQWRTLQLAPLWMFSAILGRQRDFEPLELSAFWRSVDQAAAGGSGLSGAVPQSLSRDFAQFLLEFADEPRSVVTGLWDVVAILDRLDPLVSGPFRQTLMEICERFCRARGSFGQVISRDDQRTLLLLSSLLEVEAVEGLSDNDAYA